MANKSTAFQRLEKALSGNWGQPDSMTHVNKYDMSGDNGEIIFRTRDKDEYERTKLELQQNKFLKNQWYKANVNLDVGAFSNLNYIQLMYRDADLMDAFPEIGAALDTYAEESCLVSDANGGGNGSHVVNVYSKSERIKSIIEDLLINRLNLQVTASMVIRGMCKYGNQFMLLDIDNKLGVKGWRQLPVFDVERIEHGIQNPYAQGGVAIASNTDDVAEDADAAATFIWNSQGQAQVPFRSWQIGHFRLLTNSMYLPYGVSLLNSGRRHFRMLSLMEDMMFIYRLERSMERRIYKINVGAIDDADVPAYMEEVVNRFKRTPIIDPLTGQIDLRKNILPVHKDTPIPLLDGRVITIEELAKEYEEGKDNYVYSVQDKTYQIVPGKVVWCGKNYTADKLVKITLDDDSHMIMAPEHEIIMRDGSKKRADEVKEGESVMPLYRKVDKESKKLFDRYEKTYNPNSGKFEYTHRLIGKEIEKTDEKYNTIHHKDFNKYNNNPTNLMWMDYYEHHKMHGDLARSNWADPEKRKIHCENLSKACKGRIISKETREKTSKTLKEKHANGELDYVKENAIKNLREYLNSEKHREDSRRNGILRGYRKEFEEYNHSKLHTIHNAIRSKASKAFWSDNEKASNTIKNMQVKFDDYVWNEIETKIVNGEIYTQRQLIEFINNNLIDYLLKNNSSKKLHNNNKITKGTITQRIRGLGFKNFKEYITYVEHKYGVNNYKDLFKRKKSIIAKKYNVFNNLKGSIESRKLKFDDIIWDGIRNHIISGEIKTLNDIVKLVNSKYIDRINSLTDRSQYESSKVQYRAVKNLILRTYDFETVNEYIMAMKKNHKISSIEYVGGDDVYCMTVVGLNGEEDRHNFALLTRTSNGSINNSGVFVSNCISDDIFIPVRTDNAPNPVDTLNAGQNLTAMDDIKFVQNKLATALRIPKAFMNFDEATGDGKNLALMDIRFTRQVNHIQQAFLMELTKIVSIHLYLLGFADDITNFSLTMNNPSTQAEQLELENLQKKVAVCRDAISDPGNGIPIMSQMRALKTIMKWSEKDIKENLEEIRLERAIAAELEKTTQIIKRTNIFDNVDRMYGEPGAEYAEDAGQGPNDDMGGMGGPGGGGGGASFGSGLDDLGAPGAPTDGEIQGEEGSGPTAEMPSGDEATPPQNENASRKGNILNESKQIHREKKLDDLFEKYISHIDKNIKENKINVSRTDIFDKAILINDEFNKMIESLDNVITESK